MYDSKAFITNLQEIEFPTAGLESVPGCLMNFDKYVLVVWSACIKSHFLWFLYQVMVKEE